MRKGISRPAIIRRTPPTGSRKVGFQAGSYGFEYRLQVHVSNSLETFLCWTGARRHNARNTTEQLQRALRRLFSPR